MRLLGKIGLALLIATSAGAQQVISVRAGLISYAEGSVYIDQERLQFNTYGLLEVKKGECLRTGEGRAEIQLGPGAVLRMGGGGILWMENSSLPNMQVRIERGSILVEIFEKVKNNKLRLRFEEAVIEFKQTGLYRLNSEQFELLVYGGKAEIKRAGKKVTVKKGKAADFTAGLKVSKFETKEIDPMHRWAAVRSFALYNTSSESRKSLIHWTHLAGGWMRNENYDVRIYSEIARDEQNMRLGLRQDYLRQLGRVRQQLEQKMEEDAWYSRHGD